MNDRSRYGFFCTIVLWCCQSLYAQIVAPAASGADTSRAAAPAEFSFGEITVVTATRTAEKLDEAPGSLTVITSRQIRDLNARTLRDVLNVFVPGMDVVPTYFRYGDRVNEGIYSRGLLSDFSQQVLILYNGQTKFNETTFSSPFPAIEFTLENIDRIEISRSPLPLYGGSAITTINLITQEQNAEKTEMQVNTAVNQKTSVKEGLQSKKFSMLWGHSFSKWHASGFVQYYDDQGRPHPVRSGQGGYALPGSTLRDGTKGAVNFSLSLRSLDQRWTLQSWYKHAAQDAFLSGQLPSQSSDVYNYEGSEWLTNIKFKPSVNYEINAGAMAAKWANFVHLASGPWGGDEANYDLFVEGLYTRRIGKQSWLAGVKLEKEGQYDGTIYNWDGSGFVPDKTDANLLAPNASRTVLSVYAEDNVKFSPVFGALGGVRLDYYNGFAGAEETIVNPRLAFVLTPSAPLTLKALYASAGRPPSIYERLGAALAPLYGSADIKSEKVHTLELSALVKSSRGWRAQITPFYQIFSNKIEYVEAGANEFRARNNGNTEVRGLDLDGWYYFDERNYIFANASFFSSRDVENGHDTFFIPNRYINAGANFNHQNFNFNVTGYFRNARQLPAALVVNRSKAGSHFLMNAAASYQFSPAFRAYALIENLGDRNNVVPLSVDGLFVPMRGRTLNAGMVFEWQ